MNDERPSSMRSAEFTAYVAVGASLWIVFANPDEWWWRGIAATLGGFGYVYLGRRFIPDRDLP